MKDQVNGANGPGPGVPRMPRVYNAQEFGNMLVHDLECARALLTFCLSNKPARDAIVEQMLLLQDNELAKKENGVEKKIPL